MPKQFVSKWLLDMLANGPYRDEREVKAEQREIRANAREHVDKIWEEQAKKLLPPPAPKPLPIPDWGTAPPAPPLETPPPPPPAPVEPAPIDSTDPGIGPVSRLADDYWSADPRPPGQIETIA